MDARHDESKCKGCDRYCSVIRVYEIGNPFNIRIQNMKISKILLGVLAAFISLLFYPVAADAKPAIGDKLVLMWQVNLKTSDSEMLLMKEKGINLVQAGTITWWSEEDVQKYLEMADRFGMGVIMTIHHLINREAEKASVSEFEQTRKFIQRWKSHPAVFAWHTFDEARNSSRRVFASFQEDIYKLVKGVDPLHPVFISWNGTTANHYKCCFSEKSFDMLDLHAYVQDIPGPRQKNLLKHFISQRRSSYPVMITLRAFNGPKHQDLPNDGLKKQFEFFFRENDLTTNVGLYGWSLSRNHGIRDVQNILRQFKELEIVK